MKTIRFTALILVTMLTVGMAAARADQPHMQKALEHLRAARAQLQMAEHDKGGWRTRAVRNVDQAIADTQKGMSWDRHH